MRTFIAPKPPVPNAVLTATTQGQTSIGLVASYPGIPFAGSYNFEWATSAAGPFTALTPQASAQLAHSGLSAGTTYFYRCRIGFQTGGIGIYSPIVSATTAAIPSSTSIVWNPGVRYTVGKLGAQYGSASQALTDWTTQCTNVANKNASRLVKGFQFCVPLRLLFPLAQGDWGNSLGISLGQQIQTMLNGLANGPYDISLQCNMVANTYGNQLITAATAQGFVPSWWYDNVAYGPVSGGNHGGVYWDATANGRMTARFWNAACMNEVRQVYGAMYAALEPQGIHLYRIEPTMEISGAPAMISAGMTDQALIDVLVGTTGIPNGFAADMRLALPTSLLALCITFPRSQSNTPAILEAVLSHQWSFTNYDGCNESVPADLPTGKASSNWGDLAFCGQTSVNGPIVSKNYKALGYDHHNNIVADELGNGSAAVPNAIAGTGRLPDVISHCVYEGSSHFYIYSTNSGPPCNTTGSFSGQPANYKFPATGTVVTQTNSIAYLAALNVNSALHLTYPGAFG